MSPIPCLACDRQVSDQARACPNCGQPVVSDARIDREVVRFRGFSSLIVAVALAEVAMVASARAPNPTDPIAVAAAQGFAPLHSIQLGSSFCRLLRWDVQLLAAPPRDVLAPWRGEGLVVIRAT